MRIFTCRNNDRIVLKVISVFFVIMQVTKVCLACGSYYEIGGGSVGYLASQPAYGTYINCIWWLETDPGYQLSISLTWVPDINYGRCGDYVVIQDTKDSSSIIFNGSNNCTSLTNYVVNASASWMRVQFVSDGINYTSGFQGQIYSTYVGSAILSHSDPITSCRSYEWSCSNKECVTLAYRCDGFNDCGCTTDCDEHMCEGMDLEKLEIMGIGAGVGFALFLSFFFFSFAYELHLKKRTLMADPEAQAELQRKKAEKRRREAYQKAAKEKKGRR